MISTNEAIVYRTSKIKDKTSHPLIGLVDDYWRV